MRPTSKAIGGVIVLVVLVAAAWAAWRWIKARQLARGGNDPTGAIPDASRLVRDQAPIDPSNLAAGSGPTAALNANPFDANPDPNP